MSLILERYFQNITRRKEASWLCPICNTKTEGHHCCSEKCFKKALLKLSRKSVENFNFIAERYKEVNCNDRRT